MKYIDSEKLIAGIKHLQEKFPVATYEALYHLITSLQQDKDVLDMCSQVWWEDRGWIMIPPNVTLKGIESLLERVRYKIKWNEENGIEEQEQPMPDSTKLIEFWNEDKEMLKEKDFRDDQWRLAYNAFLCGFVRGVSVKKQEQQDVEFEKEMEEYFKGWTETDEGIACHYQYVDLNTCRGIARHFYELGGSIQYQQDRAEFAKLKAKEWQSGYDEGYTKGLNARKGE